MTITITIGCPASGKSTWARQQQEKYVADGQSCAIIERDMIRDALYGTASSEAAAKWYYGQGTADFIAAETAVSEIEESMLVAAIDQCDHVIVSDCHASPASYRQTMATIDQCRHMIERHHEINHVYFAISLREAMVRNEGRANAAEIVPPDIVRRMHVGAARRADSLARDGVHVVTIHALPASDFQHSADPRHGVARAGSSA